MARTNTERNFWDKVDVRSPDECWNWQGKLSPKGYGRFHWNGREIRAHVLAYQLVVDTFPAELQIMHDCMNKKCCNPQHLLLGTIQQNHHYPDNAVVSWGLVNQLREMYSQGGYTHRGLAKAFNLAYGTVADILTRRTW